MIVKTDELGRIILPKEYREVLKIREEDEIEIVLEANEIIIKKPIFGCVFCHAAVTCIRIENLSVCGSCIEKLHNAKKNHLLYISRIE